MGIRSVFVGGALALSLSVAAASAATVTVGGDRWNVTTITGSLLDLQATLESQTWYGQYDRASAFATALGDSLGFPNYSGYDAPYFVYLNFVEGGNATAYFAALLGNLAPGDQGVVPSVTASEVNTYAVATPVPLPAGLPLLLAGLGGLAVIGKSKSRRAQV